MIKINRMTKFFLISMSCCVISSCEKPTTVNGLKPMELNSSRSDHKDNVIAIPTLELLICYPWIDPQLIKSKEGC